MTFGGGSREAIFARIVDINHRVNWVIFDL